MRENKLKKVSLVRFRSIDNIEKIVNEKLAKLKNPRVVNFIYIPGSLIGDNVLILIEYEE